MPEILKLFAGHHQRGESKINKILITLKNANLRKTKK